MQQNLGVVIKGKCNGEHPPNIKKGLKNQNFRKKFRKNSKEK